VVLKVLTCGIDIIHRDTDVAKALWLVVAIVILEVFVVLCAVVPSQSMVIVSNDIRLFPVITTYSSRPSWSAHGFTPLGELVLASAP
jgi:hypothetical protein